MRTKNHVALEYFHQLEVAHNVYYVSSTSNTSALPSTNRRTFSRGKPTGSTTNGAVKKRPHSKFCAIARIHTKLENKRGQLHAPCKTLAHAKLKQ